MQCQICLKRFTHATDFYAHLKAEHSNNDAASENSDQHQNENASENQPNIAEVIFSILLFSIL